MEELKEDGAQDDGAAASPAARKFSFPPLSRRLIIFVVAGLAVLGLLVGGVVAYVSHAKSKQAAVLAKKKAAVEAEEKAAKQAVLDAEAKEAYEKLGLEAKRAHEAVMSGSGTLVPDNSLSASQYAGDSKVVKPAESKPAEAKAQEKILKDTAPAKPSPEMAPKGKQGAVEVPKVESQEQATAAVPAASGACAVGGKEPGDYGKALSSCLEEFSRLEGRKR